MRKLYLFFAVCLAALSNVSIASESGVYKGKGFYRWSQLNEIYFCSKMEMAHFLILNKQLRVELYANQCSSPNEETGFGKNLTWVMEVDTEGNILSKGRQIGKISASPEGTLDEIRFAERDVVFIARVYPDGSLHLYLRYEDSAGLSEVGGELWK